MGDDPIWRHEPFDRVAIARNPRGRQLLLNLLQTPGVLIVHGFSVLCNHEVA